MPIFYARSGSRFSVLAAAGALTVLAAAGCSGRGGADAAATESRLGTGSGVDPNAPPPFDPLSAQAQVAKVKNILTGLPPTDAEVAQVAADPNAIAQLVAGWQALPQYAPKMLAFLGNAFQQSQVTAQSFADQGIDITAGNLTPMESNLLVQNLRESFPRTVLQNDADGMPFTSTTSTQRYMLTPPLAAFYTYLDGISYSDAGQMNDSVAAMASNPNNNVPTLRAMMDSFSTADFATWRPVTIRQPKNGEKTTAFNNMNALRSGSELVLKTPRRGYFTTATFFAGWPTNTSNVARLTINQTMIVATGRAFDGDVPVHPTSLAALDSAHAAPNSPCFTCHVNLDPMKQFLRQTYTLHFSPQMDPNQTNLPGEFAWGPVAMPGNGIDTLAQNLGSSPMFAQAWVEKLCAYANDGVCLHDDPEVLRLTQAFVGSNYSFAQLVQSLFSSPVTTFASATSTGRSLADASAVMKRDHLCPLLSSRLGIADVCGLQASTQVKGDMQTVQTIAAVLPANGYSRAALQPVFANDPSLFYRAGLENMCAILANATVDSGANAKFSSNDVPTAVAALVSGLMGVTGADALPLQSILQGHYDQAVATGAAAGDALKSTFVAACLSPSVAGMAQ